MKLAIIIKGLPNSGKTSTIKELVNLYGNRKFSVMRSGWKRIFLNKDFQYLKLDFYSVPASPSETNIQLKDRFIDWKPEVLIVALQVNGQYNESSYTFLKKNNYHILDYSITNEKGTETWNRFDKNDKAKKLGIRANEIVRDIKKFINANNITQ